MGCIKCTEINGKCTVEIKNNLNLFMKIDYSNVDNIVIESFNCENLVKFCTDAVPEMKSNVQLEIKNTEFDEDTIIKISELLSNIQIVKFTNITLKLPFDYEKVHPVLSKNRHLCILFRASMCGFLNNLIADKKCTDKEIKLYHKYIEM